MEFIGVMKGIWRVGRSDRNTLLVSEVFCLPIGGLKTIVCLLYLKNFFEITVFKEF
jgi:hypothetical protein